MSARPGHLRALAPRLDPIDYVFAEWPNGGAPPSGVMPLMQFREDEALTLIVEAAEAEQAGLVPIFRTRRIVLGVHSDLHAVGLTAAVSASLAQAGIAVNIVAGCRHDHLFVPANDAEAALQILEGLANA